MEKDENSKQKILNSATKLFANKWFDTVSVREICKENLETAKTNLENLQKQQEVLLMQLAVLTGTSSSEAQNLNRGDIDKFEYSKEIPQNIASDVIFARPDVMSAEANLEKAKIDIRVARKEFLPTFNITGLWIFNTIAPGAFFSWKSSLAAILWTVPQKEDN